jgi:hypothetical protein
MKRWRSGERIETRRKGEEKKSRSCIFYLMKFTLQLLFVSSFVFFFTDSWAHPNLKSLLSSTCCNTHSHFKHKYTQLCVCLFLFRGFCHNLPLYLWLLFVPSHLQSSLLQPILPLRAPPLLSILFFIKLYCIVLYWCCVSIETVGSSHTVWSCLFVSFVCFFFCLGFGEGGLLKGLMCHWNRYTYWNVLMNLIIWFYFKQGTYQKWRNENDYEYEECQEFMRNYNICNVSKSCISCKKSVVSPFCWDQLSKEQINNIWRVDLIFTIFIIKINIFIFGHLNIYKGESVSGLV